MGAHPATTSRPRSSINSLRSYRDGTPPEHDDQPPVVERPEMDTRALSMRLTSHPIYVMLQVCTLPKLALGRCRGDR